MKKNIWIIAICIMIIASIVPISSQQANAADTVKVGFFKFEGYHNIDEYGNRSGYGYEFIQDILRYNDFTAKYVGYDKSWDDMQKMLENGEIDILTSAQKSPDREAKFDFSKTIGTSASILTVKSGNKDIVAGKYDTYNGMRVGVIKGNSRNDSFKKFAAQKGFTYEFVYFDDTDAIQKALADGKKIDAIVTSNLRNINNEWVLDKFDPSPFYAMVKKGNTKLLSQINYAIDQMNISEVSWKNELFNKYYSSNKAGDIDFSSAERAYLNNLKKKNTVLKVVTSPDRKPYSYLGKDNKPEGIVPDIFNVAVEKTGIKYEYLKCTTRKEYQDIVKSGKADIVIDGRYDLSAAENSGYKVTEPYIENSYSMLTRRENTNKIKSVAAVKYADTSASNLDSFYKDKNVSYYDSVDECIKKVKSGKADATYLYSYSAQTAVAEDYGAVLQASLLPYYEDGLSFSAKNTKDHRLLSILNRVALNIKGQTVDTIIKDNTQYSSNDITFGQYLYRNPIILIMLLIIVFVLVGLIVYLFQKKKGDKASKEKQKELERFIGYICKANSQVIEVNFKNNIEKSFSLENDNVVYEEKTHALINAENPVEDIHPDDFKEMVSGLNYNIQDFIDNDSEKYFECRMKENGQYKWYSLTLKAIPRDDSHPMNIIVFKRDIDEAKKREEERSMALRDALSNAKHASESKGNFMSKMSHEIRTPLNAIIGYLDLATIDKDDLSKVSHYIENSKVASKHLLSIINDVLDISSIESGKMKIAYEDFDLKGMINNITTIFYNQAKEKGINFEVSLDGITQEWVIGDNLRLNQVLMNLLSNALKFTDKGGTVKFNVYEKNIKNDKVFIKFEISDSGIGMSKEFMDRIFTPFEQQDASTARNFGGTGLGLSISNNLVSMMGGNIDVDSVENEGSTFTVHLQMGLSKENNIEHKEADFSKLRALIVDDDENTLTYIKSLLKRYSVKSDVVNSGEKAIKQIRRRMDSEYKYDLCIIDWNMPEKDGVETAKEIKRLVKDPMPIIIATAYDTSEFENEAEEAGITKIISKPLFQSTLFDLLVSTFGKYEPQIDEDTIDVDLKGMKILLAEDNDLNMEIAVTMLEKYGVNIVSAVDGQEAVDKFMNESPGTFDAILMDIQMPKLNGYEATSIIRQSEHEDAKTIPIIAMTANAFREDVADALAAGMNDHISKPVEYNKLLKVLSKFIKK